MIYDCAIMIRHDILCCLFYFILFCMDDASCAILLALGGPIIQPNFIFSPLFLSYGKSKCTTSGICFMNCIGLPCVANVEKHMLGWGPWVNI